VHLGILILATLILPPPSGAAKPQTEAAHQERQRDLQRYDKAGPFALNMSDPERREVVLSSMREFLWAHYRDHRLGYLVYTHKTKEGDPGTTSYWIEPDATGSWHVHCRTDMLYLDRSDSSASYRRSYAYDAYTLERTRISQPSAATETIPALERTPGRLYRLTFIARDGKTFLGRL